MSVHRSPSLTEVAQVVCHQGFVDQSSLSTLENYFCSDSVIDQSKADILFRIHASVSDSPQTSPAWQTLFVQSICRFVVFDLNSPGEVAECEADWLRSHLSDSKELSKTEIELLREIQRNSTCDCPQMKGLFDRALSYDQPLEAQPTPDQNAKR